MRMVTVVGSLALVLMGATFGAAENVGVSAHSLRVGESRPRKGSSIELVARDRAIDVDTGADPSAVGAELHLAYENGAAAGRLTLPSGAFDGTSGWIRNRDDRLRYVNRDAPDGPTQTRSLVLRAGKGVDVDARGTGDVPFAVLAGGDPAPGRVLTALCVTTAAAQRCFCSAFSRCDHRAPGGTRAQLSCTDGAPDPTCGALQTTDGTSTTTSSTTSSTIVPTTTLVTTSTTTTTLPQTGVTLELSADPVRRGEPIDLRVVVRNHDADPCRIVAPTYALAIAVAGPSGGAVTPRQLLVSYTDGLLAAVEASSVEVPAGGAVELAMHGIPELNAATVTVLHTVSGTDDVSVLDNLWPFADAGSYDVTATLRPPDLLGLTGPLCQGGATASTTILVVDPPSSAPLAMMVPLLVCLPRRRRRGLRRVLAAVAMLALGVRPAHATLIVDPSLQSAFDACMQMFTMTGMDTSFLGAMQNNPNDFQIVPNGDTHGGGPPNGLYFLYWNPNDAGTYADGTAHDSCASLLHELEHAREHAEKGEADRSPCFVNGRDVGLPKTEVDASDVENDYRDKKGLGVRTTYGKQQLPPRGTKCDPPAAPPPPAPSSCTGNCGRTTGDPHLTTFDGLHYDFQGAGEFVLATSTADDLAIHVRERPWFSLFRGSVAVNVAIGVRVAGTTVTMAARGLPAPVTTVSGVETVLPIGPTPLPGGGALERAGDAITVRWPDDTALTVTQSGGAVLNLEFSLATARAGQVAGLLGDADGDPSDDLRTRGGDVVGVPPLDRAALYDRFGDSWRVSDAESLLPYGPGESTATFTDRAFPAELVSARDLGDTAAAETLCRAQGVVLPGHLDDCILDVAATGEVGFTAAAASAQRFVGDAAFEAHLGDTLANAVAAGTRHRHAFEAVAGTPITLQSSTTSGGSATWRLLGPDGATLLGPAPVADDLGPIVLSWTGIHQIAVDGGGTGASYVLDLLTARPSTVLPIAIGSSATGTLAAGGRVTYELRVRPTRFVYPNADMPPGDHRTWRVESPSGRVVATNELSVDLGRLVLSEDGFYRLVIEDAAGVGGGYAFTLIAAGADVETDVPVIPGAGAVSVPPAGRVFMSFPAAEGTVVTFISDTTAIDGRRWQLLGPDGVELTDERGMWTDLPTVTLPFDSTYTLVFSAIDESGGTSSFHTRIE